MTNWLAGMRVTAGRLNNHDPVDLTSTVTAATGFSLSVFDARKAAGVVEFNVTLIRSGASLAAADSAGNMIDVVCATMPTDCLPAGRWTGAFEKSGQASGGVRIEANGVVTLVSMDPTSQITSGATINFSGAFATG